MRHVPVVLKVCKSAEAAKLEAGIMGLLGPDIAPEVYETLYEEGAGQHLLVMQVLQPGLGVLRPGLGCCSQG